MLQTLKQHYSSSFLEGGPMPSFGNLRNLNEAAVKLPFEKDKQYDVVIIGGGTGGIGFA